GFFFSSRRRHTRWPRDWSSDVCSSDLGTGERVKSATNESGEFHFLALRPGDYSVTTVKTGFMTLRRSGIKLPVADRIALDLQLRSEERRVGKECRCWWVPEA